MPHADDGLRQFVGRQAGGQVLSQRGGVEARFRLEPRVGHQLAALAVQADQRQRFVHVRMSAERGGDAVQFDAVAAVFDLGASAAEEADAAVGQVFAEVAAAVQPRAGQAGHGVRHEAGGGAAGLADIAARQRLAADVDLAGHAGRH